MYFCSNELCFCFISIPAGVVKPNCLLAQGVTMNPRAFAKLILLALGYQLAKCTSPGGTSFVKLRVPDGYFLEMEGHAFRQYRTHSDCAFACSYEEACEAFAVQGGKCAIGTMNMTDPHVPSFVLDGTDVMVKKTKVAFNDVSVPHIAGLGVNPDLILDAAIPVDGTEFSSVPVPRYPNKEDDRSLFGLTDYRGGLVACGGTEAGDAVRTCHRWSFRSGAWSPMGGELTHNHFEGQLVAVGHTLWMFMGRQTQGGGPHKRVESYDTRLGEWREEPDADVNNGVHYFAAAVYSDTKVRGERDPLPPLFRRCKAQ